MREEEHEAASQGGSVKTRAFAVRELNWNGSWTQPPSSCAGTAAGRAAWGPINGRWVSQPMGGQSNVASTVGGFGQGPRFREMRWHSPHPAAATGLRGP